jgi:hypothetical protein
MLVGCGVIVVVLLAYLPRPQKKEAALVQAAAEPLPPPSNTAAKAAAPLPTPTSDKTASSEFGDDKTKLLEKAVKASQKDGNADGVEPAPPAHELPTKPQGPTGIVADQQKGVVDEGPAVLLGDAPRKPEPLAVPKEPLAVPKEPLGVPEEPKLPVVADTPEGLYGARTKPKTPEWLALRGGTVESQKAVEDGLDWLARHQGKDGHWGADCLGTGLNSRCDRNGPCRVSGWAYDVAHTGLALLAFQAGGHYSFNGQKYSAQVAKGLDCLVQGQSLDGSFVDPQIPNREEMAALARWHAGFMYEHAIATFALCEGCAVALAEGKTPNPRYRNAAQRALSFIENVQHDDGGWRYRVDRNELSDTSVTGWVMLALKTAREARLNVSPQTISRMMEFFAAHYENGRTEYYALDDTVIAPGAIVERSIDDRPSTDAMMAVGMLAVEFFEHKLDSPIVQAGAAYLADQAGAVVASGPVPRGAIGIRPPKVNTDIDIMKKVAQRRLCIKGNGYYDWYHCTMAMFQVGGKPWKHWNDAVRDYVIRLQVGDVTKLEEKGERLISMTTRGVEYERSCERGSWSPDGDPFGNWGGRIYTTALAVLTLEVYYRFERIAGQPEKEKFFEK